MKNPTISVIIPTNNRSKLLERAIKSVQLQTFNDIEIIIIDDCSTDNTSEQIEKNSDPRIRYFKHEMRLGGSAARNTGISVSRGQYIAFLDDDDEWLPDKLKLQLNKFKKNNNLGLIYTGFTYYNNNNLKLIRTFNPYKSGFIYKDLLESNYIGTTSSVMVKKHCLDKIGLFDPCLKSCQDWDLWIRIAKEFPVDYIQKSLVKFYIHKIRISHNLESRIQGREMLFQKIFNEIKNERRFLSIHQLALGQMYCHNGEHEKGKWLLWQSLKNNPYNLICYRYFCPALLGARTYKTLQAIRQKFTEKFEEET